MKKAIILSLLTCIGTMLFGQEMRLITLNSSITETVFALGLGSNIVATDVTSVSPKAASELPRVSKNRSVSVEGILAYKPQKVLANSGEVSPTIIKQLKHAGVEFIEIVPNYSVKGALNYIQSIANGIGETEKGKVLVKQTEMSLEQTLTFVKQHAAEGSVPSVLFIYARGTGTMSVAGKGSSLDAMIKLAGGKNAIQEFSDFKPYTTEALVKANPDIILMFDFGANSLGGIDRILKMPGMQNTNAGKHKRLLLMNSSLLVNFSNRLPEAIAELHKGFQELMKLK